MSTQSINIGKDVHLPQYLRYSHKIRHYFLFLRLEKFTACGKLEMATPTLTSESVNH